MNGVCTPVRENAFYREIKRLCPGKNVSSSLRVSSRLSFFLEPRPRSGAETTGFFIPGNVPGGMTGARALAVVLLVALGAAGGLAVAAEQQPQPSMSVLQQENTSAFLSPDPGAVERTGRAEPGLDVATAVSANAGGIRATHYQTGLERRYESADTDDRRRAVVRAGAQRASERLDRLHQRELNAFQQYRNGAIGDRELLRRLAEIHREAAAVDETLRWIESRSGGSAVSEQAGADRVRAVRLQSPLRELIADSFAG
jgi:hypothetical protein